MGYRIEEDKVKHSDKKITEITGLTKNALEKIRARLRKKGIISVREQIDDEVLRIIVIAIEFHNRGTFVWADAVDQAITARSYEKILECDESADSITFSILKNCLNHERTLLLLQEIGDIITSWGIPEIANNWHRHSDLFFRDVAFQVAARNGLIKKTNDEILLKE
jgi:hypothetical protein